jgi:hypothetical protein
MSKMISPEDKNKKLPLTRTVVLINLSRFLRGFLLSRKFLLQVVPGYAHLPASKFVYRDKFMAPSPVCTAILHQVASNKFLHRDKLVVARKFVPRLRQHARKFVP